MLWGLILLCVVLGLSTSLWWGSISSNRKSISSPDLDKLPGPRVRHPLGGYFNALKLFRRKAFLPQLDEWRKEYGPVYRLTLGWIDNVMLSSASHIQKIISSKDEAHLGKPGIYDVLRPTEGFDGLLHSKGGKWKSRRRLISPIMQYSSLLRYYQVVNLESRRMVLKLEEMFRSSDEDEDSLLLANSEPILPVLFDTTLSCLCKITLGENVIQGDVIYDATLFSSAIQRGFEILNTRLVTPWLTWGRVFRLHPLARELDTVMEFMKGVIHKLKCRYEIREHQSSSENVAKISSSSSSLLGDMVQAGLPFEGIFEEVVTFITGGYETTGGILHNLLFLLALHPQHQDRCRDEVDLMFQEEELGCPSGEISLAGAKGLQYLERCVMETLRRLPVGPMIARQIDAAIKLDDDLELSPGTILVIDLKGLHMNPEYYPNPEHFDPDRWLPERKDKLDVPYSYLPFSGGPRICVGHKFAMMLLIILSARILRHFEIMTTDRLEDVEWLPNAILTPETPMRFILKKRRHDMCVA